MPRFLVAMILLSLPAHISWAARLSHTLDQPSGVTPVTDVTGMPTKGDPPDLVNALNALFENRIPAMHRLGIRIVELREDFVAGTAPLAGNLNYQSSMYAGTLFGLGEALGAGLFIANFDLSRFTATVRAVQIRYRRPAMTDVRAEASLDASTIARIKREAEEAGKTEFVLHAELTDTAGAVVTTTQATYQVRALPSADTA
jgi:acyl-coenzyme A thioesterase PaaI-like protein